MSPGDIRTAAPSQGSDIRRGAGRKRRFIRRRHRGQLRQRRQLRSRRSVHPGGLAEGPGNLPINVFQKLDAQQHRRGYEWHFDDIALIGIQKWAARLTVTLGTDSPTSGIQVRTRERLTLGDWYHVTMTYDGSGKAAGLRLYVNGALADIEVVRDALTGSIATDAPLRLGSHSPGAAFVGQIDDLRLYNRTLTPDEITDLAIHYTIRVILSGVLGKRSKDDTADVRDYFLTYAAPDALRAAYAEVKTLRKEKEAFQKSIPTTMVMAEMGKPRDTFVLGRGDYRNQGDKVQPGVPAMLPALPKDAPPNRLTLAKWLVDPGHPLTARVAVNRFWQQYFGLGIVKTQEDFGVQGEAPPIRSFWIGSRQSSFGPSGTSGPCSV